MINVNKYTEKFERKNLTSKKNCKHWRLPMKTKSSNFAKLLLYVGCYTNLARSNFPAQFSAFQFAGKERREISFLVFLNNT